MFTFQILEEAESREPWNKGKLVGQRRPLKLKEIWGIRIRLRVADVTHSGQVMSRATVMQQVIRQRVQFEIIEETQESVGVLIAKAALTASDDLSPTRTQSSARLSNRQYTELRTNGTRTLVLTLCCTAPIPCAGRKRR